MNGTITGVIFRDLDQPAAYEVLTEILGFSPSRANELIDAAQRPGGITDNGVHIVQPYGTDTWTISKDK